MTAVPTRVFDNPNGRGIVQIVRDEQRHAYLTIAGENAFQWDDLCDTCRYVFTKVMPADSLRDAVDKDLANRVASLLKDVRDMPDELALAEVASMLSPGRYTAMLVPLFPQLTMPGDALDYFAHEAVETWGLDRYHGTPHSPNTPYYRLGSIPVRDLYLGVVLGVPLYPPTRRQMHRRDVVENYARVLREGESRPTTLALATVDDRGPAVWDDPPRFNGQLIVTLFLLDGHHKVLAAAESGLPLQFLALFPHTYLDRVHWDVVREGIDLLRRMVEVGQARLQSDLTGSAAAAPPAPGSPPPS